MSVSRKVLVIGCCVASLWACARQPDPEEAADLTEDVTAILPDQPADPAIVSAAPMLAKTVFANEWVGVARVDLAPDELIPPHEAGTRYVYPLSACTLSVDDNGTEEVAHLVPGELAVWPAGRLSLANVDDTGGEFLVIERHPIETSPELETLAVPDIDIEMERHGTVLLDDESVTAVDVTLAQLTSDPLPPDLPLLVMALGDCDLQLHGDAVPDVEEVMKAGEAIWQAAGYNVVENIGDGQAHFLVISFRK
jgi:hypothetical protein